MAPTIIPEPGSVPNVAQDAKQALQTLKSGGVVVVPMDVGYTLLASTSAGISKIFTAKGRREGHNIGIIGTYKQHREIHALPEAKFEFTRVMTEVMGMVAGLIAKFDPNDSHSRLAKLDKATLSQVTKDDTVSIAVAEGPFVRELGRLCDAETDGMLIFGTSANATGQGQHFRVEDIEASVLEHVDLVVDYGLQKWHRYGYGGINFDVENMRTLRAGAGYEVFEDRAKRWFPHLWKEAE